MLLKWTAQLICVSKDLHSALNYGFYFVKFYRKLKFKTYIQLLNYGFYLVKFYRKIKIQNCQKTHKGTKLF